MTKLYSFVFTIPIPDSQNTNSQSTAKFRTLFFYRDYLQHSWVIKRPGKGWAFFENPFLCKNVVFFWEGRRFFPITFLRILLILMSIYVMHSNKTGNKSHRPILRYEQLKVQGIMVKNNSSVDFEIFVFLHTLICFLSPPCNFWLIFKHFPTKNSAFSAACHIQIGTGLHKTYRNRKL